MRWFFFWVILFLIPLSVAAEEGFIRMEPDLHSSFTPEPGATEAGLWQVMKEAEESMKHSPSRIVDPELEQYMQDILCRLAAGYCRDIRVYVIRKPYFNASMAPNGMLQVWSGLLLRVGNEAQLASVLGHELGHYLKRHSLKGFEDQKMKANILTFITLGLGFAVATGNLNTNVGQTASDLSQLAMIASMFSYSRSQESEADKFGIQLIADANYRVDEPAAIWTHLIAEEDLSKGGKDRDSLFFSTHPSPKGRIKDLNTYATQLRPADGETMAGSEAYYRILSPHLDLLMQDEMDLNQPARTEYVLMQLQQAGIAPGLVHYYLGELYRIRDNPGDRLLALDQYERSLGDEDAKPEVHRQMGILYLKEKNRESARRSFARYLELMPDANDSEMIEYYMTL